MSEKDGRSGVTCTPTRPICRADMPPQLKGCVGLSDNEFSVGLNIFHYRSVEGTVKDKIHKIRHYMCSN